MPLVIGLLALGVLTCVGVFVVMFVGGAAAFLLARSPASTVSGPVSVAAPVATIAAPASPRRMDGPFVVASAKESTEALPGRFHTPLPISSDEWDRMLLGAKEFPPHSWVADQACAGDAEMNARLLAGIPTSLRTSSGSRGGASSSPRSPGRSASRRRPRR